MKEIDILIIGGGQCGLAMGYSLLETKYSFHIVESNPRIGDSWRKRYDMLSLFTTREISSLPGLELTGDPEGYALRDEFGDYLENYAKHFNLPVEVNTSIIHLEKIEDEFIAKSQNGTVYKSKSVILANGPYQQPIILGLARKLSPDVMQFNIENYKNADQIPKGSTVLIVGDGATGRDMSAELSNGNNVFLAKGGLRWLMPERILGFAPGKYLTKVGVVTAPSESMIAKIFRKLDPFPDRDRNFKALKRMGVTVKPRLLELDDKTAKFQDGTSVTIDAICWAVGYKDRSWEWVKIPGATDEKGTVLHTHGISPIKNLFFIGRPWQTCRASALVFGAKRDSEMIRTEVINSLAS